MKHIMEKFRPSPAMAVALVALVGTFGGAGWAANGAAFVLGIVNSATARTFLGANYNGTALQLSNTSAGAAATALTLTTAATRPPLAVNSAVKVAKFNADYVDGLDSTSLARVRRIPFTLATGATSAPIVLPANLPVHVTGFEIGGHQNLGQATIVSDSSFHLYWVGADSGASEANSSGNSHTAGDHIVWLDLGQGNLELQVSGGTAIQVHNGSVTARSGEITLMW